MGAFLYGDSWGVILGIILVIVVYLSERMIHWIVIPGTAYMVAVFNFCYSLFLLLWIFRQWRSDFGFWFQSQAMNFLAFKVTNTSCTLFLFPINEFLLWALDQFCSINSVQISVTCRIIVLNFALIALACDLKQIFSGFKDKAN